MDPFTLARSLLGDTVLDAGQLAQLRALNTKYFTQLYAIGQSSGDAAAMERRRDALHERILADIRDMLTDEQRVVFDRSRGPMR